ncbi:MAG: DUF423 domain-containing protein [Idiomarina sp.]
MSFLFIIIAAFTGLTAVVLGAAASHALRSKLAEPLFNAMQTGIQYQFYHTLALFMVALLMIHMPSRWLLISGWLFVAGMILFSGSLYALALTGQSWFGPITPLGGLCLMAGWLSLAIAAMVKFQEL